MTHYPNNALLLTTDKPPALITVEKASDIKATIKDRYPEMVLYYRHPVRQCRSDEERDLIEGFLRSTTQRGKALPPPLEGEYDFHRITQVENIQMYVTEMGALDGSPVNPYFDGHIYGDVIILGHCIDELPYE